jgi:hypothetical protein
MARARKCEREAVTVIVIYKPRLHSSQSILGGATLYYHRVRQLDIPS